MMELLETEDKHFLLVPESLKVRRYTKTCIESTVQQSCPPCSCPLMHTTTTV